MSVNFKKNHALRNFLFLVMSVVLIILGISIAGFLINMRMNGSKMAMTFVDRLADDAKQRSEELLKPVTGNLTIIKQWGQTDFWSLDKTRELSLTLIPMFAQYPQINACSISDSSGRCFALMRIGNEWISVYQDGGSKDRDFRYWNRYTIDGKFMSDWSEKVSPEAAPFTVVPDADLLPWEEGIYWEEGIRAPSSGSKWLTCATQWKNEQRIFRASLEFVANEVAQQLFSNFTSPGAPRDGAQETFLKVFLVREDGETVLLSEADSLAAMHSKELIQYATTQWFDSGRRLNEMLKFTKDGKPFYCEFKSLNNNTVCVGVLTDGAFMERGGKDFRNALIVSVCVTLFGVLMFFFVKNVQKKEQALLEQGYMPKPETEVEWLDLIAKGENTFLEFKSSLRWDVRNNCKEARLEEVIMKSVAAFNNGSGGILLIGVDDEGMLLGLEKDYTTLKSPDKDSFELHLRNLLNAEYGVDYCTSNVTVSFPLIGGREICAVEVEPGEYPIYVKISDPKSGRKLEKFYVRSGNSSREIMQLSDISKYIAGRFRKYKNVL